MQRIYMRAMQPAICAACLCVYAYHACMMHSASSTGHVDTCVCLRVGINLSMCAFLLRISPHEYLASIMCKCRHDIYVLVGRVGTSVCVRIDFFLVYVNQL